MKLIFVHGWSVTNTNNYRDLPATVIAQCEAQGIEVAVEHVYLGKYISFHDEVSVDDIARALQQALLELPGNEAGIQPFSCVTHSTGGPIVRYWLHKYHADLPEQLCPLQHLVMLAPANHGASLASIGQKRVGRIKSWFSGVEPGQRVLDWLKLGSDGQYQLNKATLTSEYFTQGVMPFVIAGQGIDTKMYDFLNSYLVENGSDGIIRVAGANLNYQFIHLQQTDDALTKKTNGPLSLAPTDQPAVKTPVQVPLLVLDDASHFGGKMGLLNSEHASPVHLKIAQHIVQCLLVESSAQYQALLSDWKTATDEAQQRIPVGKNDKISRYGMLVFRVQDDAGDVLNVDDFDVLFLAGKTYSADKLPCGFFVDKQANFDSNTLVFYVDIEKMLAIKDGLFGVAIRARPEKGFSYYRGAEFRADKSLLAQIFVPNETTYFDITLSRKVDKNVFRFVHASEPQGSFKGTQPSKQNVK